MDIDSLPSSVFMLYPPGHPIRKQMEAVVSEVESEQEEQLQLAWDEGFADGKKSIPKLAKLQDEIEALEAERDARNSEQWAKDGRRQDAYNILTIALRAKYTKVELLARIQQAVLKLD